MQSKKTNPFRFKQFTVKQEKSAMKVNTDSILLGSWANITNAHRVLDIGTGTGLLALMIAQRSSQSIIDAIEIDFNAAQEAQYNFSNSKFSDRITCHHRSLQEFALQTNIKYDLIITNPPYFEEGIISPNSQRSQARHTAHLSFLDLISLSDKLLTNTGHISMVIPFQAGQKITSIAQNHQLFVNRELHVQSTPLKPFNRLLLELSRLEKPHKTESLAVYNTNNSYSECFKTHTKNFYLNI